MASYPIEIIPDDDLVFRNVNLSHFMNPKQQERKIIPPGMFQIKSDERGMSVDWEKYISPVEARDHLANELDKDPNEYWVIQISVGCGRDIERIDIEHDPRENKRSHSLILGIPKSGISLPKNDKRAKRRIRRELVKCSDWILTK